MVAFCFTGAGALAAVQEVGTLTLAGETVVFHTPLKDVIFDLLQCPGLHLIKYDPKTIKKGDEEIDVSEAVFADDAGHRFTLIQGKPQDITRVMEGTRTTWKFSVKFRS